MRIVSTSVVAPSGIDHSRNPSNKVEEPVNAKIKSEMISPPTKQMQQQQAGESFRLIAEDSSISKSMKTYQRIESFGGSDGEIVMLDITV
ncbi:hypothetical protein [Gynuella sp.]|uniref:hypothetical protein n=1 Tax=Gynuella sp. TaxID=2969146 RepID=UPI003D11E74D